MSGGEWSTKSPAKRDCKLCADDSIYIANEFALDSATIIMIRFLLTFYNSFFPLRINGNYCIDAALTVKIKKRSFHVSQMFFGGKNENG